MLCCAAHTRTHKQTQTQTNTNTHRHTAPCALFCSCLALAVCTGFVAEGVYWLFQRSPGRVFHIIVSTATTRVSSPVTPRWPLIQPPPSLSRAHTHARILAHTSSASCFFAQILHARLCLIELVIVCQINKIREEHI